MFKMFRAFRIHSWVTLLNIFCRQFKQYIDFFFGSTHLSYLWGVDLCRYMILFCISLALKRKCAYILWIWLFSPLESMLSFWILLEDTWLVDSFCISCVIDCRYVIPSISQSGIFQVIISEISFVINWWMEERWWSQVCYFIYSRWLPFVCAFKCIYNLFYCNILVHLWFIIFKSVFYIFSQLWSFIIWFLVAPYITPKGFQLFNPFYINE